SAGSGGFAAIQTAAASLKVELIPIGVHEADEIERGITNFVRESNAGLFLGGLPSAVSASNRERSLRPASPGPLLAVFATRAFVPRGGLTSYGSDPISECRRAAGYVARIFKGEKPADLPVQAPTKYDLVINTKTAKAAGIDIPLALRARSDEVIE